MNQFLVACFVHVGNIACGCFRNHAKSTYPNFLIITIPKIMI